MTEKQIEKFRTYLKEYIQAQNDTTKYTSVTRIAKMNAVQDALIDVSDTFEKILKEENCKTTPHDTSVDYSIEYE